MLYQSDGIVLDQSDFGENDKIATVFTRQEGLVRAVVKGAGRPKSKLRALTQPFTYGLFQFFRGRELDRITQASLKRGFPGIYASYEKMIYARYLVELVTSVLPEKERNTGLFEFFLSVVGCLEEKQDPWVVARWAELGILKLAGFAPSFSHCVSCGMRVKQLPQDRPLYFSPKHGGALCGGCGTEGAHEFIRVSPGALKTLEILSDTSGLRQGPCPNITAKGQVREEINQISRKYVSFVLDKRLKSAALVESIEEETN